MEASRGTEGILPRRTFPGGPKSDADVEGTGDVSSILYGGHQKKEGGLKGREVPDIARVILTLSPH